MEVTFKNYCSRIPPKMTLTPVSLYQKSDSCRRESKRSRSCLSSCWVQSPALLLKRSKIIFSQHPARGYNKALNSPNHSVVGGIFWWPGEGSVLASTFFNTPECVSRAMRSEFSWVDNTKHLRDQIYSASSASYPECTLRRHSMNVTGQIPKPISALISCGWGSLH